LVLLSISGSAENRDHCRYAAQRISDYLVSDDSAQCIHLVKIRIGFGQRTGDLPRVADTVLFQAFGNFGFAVRSVPAVAVLRRLSVTLSVTSRSEPHHGVALIS